MYKFPLNSHLWLVLFVLHLFVKIAYTPAFCIKNENALCFMRFVLTFVRRFSKHFSLSVGNTSQVPTVLSHWCLMVWNGPQTTSILYCNLWIMELYAGEIGYNIMKNQVMFQFKKAYFVGIGTIPIIELLVTWSHFQNMKCYTCNSLLRASHFAYQDYFCTSAYSLCW